MQVMCHTLDRSLTVFPPHRCGVITTQVIYMSWPFYLTQHCTQLMPTPFSCVKFTTTVIPQTSLTLQYLFYVIYKCEFTQKMSSFVNISPKNVNIIVVVLLTYLLSNTIKMYSQQQSKQISEQILTESGCFQLNAIDNIYCQLTFSN